MLILLALFALIILPLISAYFISAKVYRSLKAKENRRATLISIGIFIGSSLVIAYGIFLLLIYNIRIER